MDDLIDRDSSHAHGKAPKIHEIDNPIKQIPPTKEVQISPREWCQLIYWKSSLKGLQRLV